MGAKGFLLAPATNAMIGQRLVRRICENCKEEFTPPVEQVERARKILESIKKPDREFDINQLKFYQGRGCEKCHQLKYKGRVGIYEILIMNPEIEKLILAQNISEYQIQAIAVENGMITMVQDGVLKALAGLTTLEEIFRVAEE
jgi:type II secretory ATPase GspE/PulE/Tfp pilus assembly ATPase PilB-like protein